MPVLADPKREKFAQLCARGLPTVDAQVRAGYRRNTGNATSLRKRPEIQARIDEIRGELRDQNQEELQDYLKESGISYAYLIKQMMDIAMNAKKDGEYAVAAKAIKDVGGELFGMFQEHRAPLKKDNDQNALPSHTTINIANISKDINELASAGSFGVEIDGDAVVVDTSRPQIPFKSK